MKAMIGQAELLHAVMHWRRRATQHPNLTPSLTFKTSDIDECSADSTPCDESADCTNSEGSYSCACKQGFTGDGTVCKGKSSI